MTTAEKKRIPVQEMLDALEDPDLESSLEGQEVTAESFNAFDAAPGASAMRSRKKLRARFFGASTDNHAMDVKPAAKALIALQDVLSAIGATLSDHRGLVGQLPASIVDATRLTLSPVVAPGSVIFTLQPPPPAEGLLSGIEEDDALLDSSVTRLIEILNTAETSGEDPEILSEMLHQTGPRTASHLFNLTDALLSEDVGLGLEWLNGKGGQRSAQISRHAAGFLRALAKTSSVQTENVTISGTLSTISKNHQQELTLEDQTRVKFSATEEQLRELAPHALSSVALQLIEKTAVKLATGTVSRSYTLIGLRESELETTASQSGQSVV